MSTLSYDYIAQLYKPRNDSKTILIFVAPAADIRGWAGVPRKAFDYQHGFQRTLQDSRIEEVAEFFRQDVRNISPTSVVVGFTGPVSIEPIDIGVEDAYSCTVRLRIQLDDLDELSIADLTDRALASVRNRLPLETVESIEANVETAVAQAIRLEDEEAVDEEFGIDSDEIVDQDVHSDTSSYLGDFYARLLGYKYGLTQWPEETPFRQVLYSLLKPGIIVDGQHRVFGAAIAYENMLLAVCAIPDASWAESVYQFVVINQKAKPIKPAFLSSIIATSLNNEEIASVYNRLGSSKIDVARAEIMERVNTDPLSPFKGMINFEVRGAEGFLQFPGMSTLARDFHRIPKTYPVLLPGANWSGVEDTWIDHFFAFWRGIRRYFEGRDGRLWLKPSEDNPNNLLKIVTLQEVQRLVLASWADGRFIKLGRLSETEDKSFLFWEEFPTTFFTDEWKKKGLQTSVGRQIIASAIMDTRRNVGRKGWGHRRLGLFQD